MFIPTSFGLLRFILAGIALASLLKAETPEQVVNPKTARNEWVSDMAGVIDNADERQINALVNSLEQKTGAEIAVVTIRRTDGRSPKEFATALFNRWGIGKKGKDNGVLVLLVMDARRIEVETGYGIEGALTDGKVGGILDRHVIPKFKKGDFSGGLLAGVQQIANIIVERGLAYPEVKEPQVGASGENESDFQRVVDDTKSPFYANTKFILLLSLLLVLLTGFVFYFYYTRFCPQCRKKMRRLSEKQDDAYLPADQKFEEDIGSINYRVWRCDDCEEMKIERKVRWLRGYSKCPQCKHRTISSHTIRVLEPTYRREGIAEKVKICLFPRCKYKESVKKSIPRRFDSGGGGGWGSSGGGSWSNGGGGGGGGGSFGGGSSGGGGAGRSW